MICCDICENWYHGSCVGITKAKGKEMEKNNEEYVCPPCKGQLLYLRVGNLVIFTLNQCCPFIWKKLIDTKKYSGDYVCFSCKGTTEEGIFIISSLSQHCLNEKNKDLKVL